MNFITSLQKSIDYMEEHLLEPIGYEEVARQVYMSSYHFHRIFSMVTGITVKEYITKRRLSLAGEDVVLSNDKIIDIAFNYGYQTPESFTKAFVRFHGVSPSVARRSGAKLKLFNRLLIKIQLEGGTAMDYRIEKTMPFKLLTKVRAFRNEIIAEENNTEIPDFWKESIENHVLENLRDATKQPGVYGVCAPVDKESTHFKYGIGMVYGDGEIPEGYEVWDVNPSLWAVFKCVGDTPDCIGETWTRIFNEFLPSSGYEMLDDTDFEYYPDEEEDGVMCEVWIPVKKGVEKNK